MSTMVERKMGKKQLAQGGRRGPFIAPKRTMTVGVVDMIIWNTTSGSQFRQAYVAHRWW
jgi:hypothetical protein